MISDKYKLRYLPLFYEDFREAIAYIRDVLKNEKVANDLIDLTETAILERLDNCESFEPYNSKKERKYPYYRIYVKNYIIFYVVIKDEGDIPVMEVRRFIYIGRDRDNII